MKPKGSKWAPQHFEIQFLRLETRWARQMADASTLAKAGALAVIASMLYLIFNHLISGNAAIRPLNGTRNLMLFIEFSFFLGPLALLSLKAQDKDRKQMVLAIASALSLGAIWFKVQYSPIVLLIPALLLAFLGCRYLVNHIGRWKAFSAFSIGFWALYVGLFLNSEGMPNASRQLFWDLKTPFLWIFLSLLLFRDKIEPAQLLNPIQIFRGTIWPDAMRFANSLKISNEIFWQGCLNLFIGLAIASLRFAIDSGQPASGLTPLNTVLVMLIRALTDIALFNCLVGFTRCFGFNTQDATYFVLLSKTPAEFWRRGSVYTYQFTLRYIFFPILRYSKFPMFALFCAFSVFFLNRFGLEGFFEFSQNSIVALFVFVLYFTSIVVTQRYWFFTKQQLSMARFAWTSVFLTHMINVAIVFAARKLASLV